VNCISIFAVSEIIMKNYRYKSCENFPDKIIVLFMSLWIFSRFL